MRKENEFLAPSLTLHVVSPEAAIFKHYLSTGRLMSFSAFPAELAVTRDEYLGGRASAPRASASPLTRWPASAGFHGRAEPVRGAARDGAGRGRRRARPRRRRRRLRPDAPVRPAQRVGAQEGASKSLCFLSKLSLFFASSVYLSSTRSSTRSRSWSRCCTSCSWRAPPRFGRMSRSRLQRRTAPRLRTRTREPRVGRGWDGMGRDGSHILNTDIVHTSGTNFPGDGISHVAALSLLPHSRF